MELNIISPNTQVTDPIRNYVDQKVGKLGKFFDGIHHGTVTLRNNEHAKTTSAELVFAVARGNTLVAHATHEDMYAAIDLAVDKMKRNIRRFTGKLRGRRSGGVPAFESSPLKGEEVVAEEEDE